MVIVAGKTVDFQGIAGFMMGLKPDIVSIYLQSFDFGQTAKCGIYHNLYKSARSIAIHAGWLVLIIEHQDKECSL